MKVLFFGIFTIVFLLGRLVAPSTFSLDLLISESTVIPTPLPTPTITPFVHNDDLEVIQNPTQAAAVTPAEAVQPSYDDEIESIFGTEKTVDTFERGSSGFGLSAGLNDDDAIRIIALNNKLSLEPKKNNGWLSWRLRPPSIIDGAAEIEFSITTCARGDRMGIMMHAPDYTSGNGYYISLACEGTVSVLRDSTVIASADVRNTFKNSSGDVNILSGIIQGNTITVKLNGQSVLRIQDDTYQQGFSGFFTAPQEQDTLRLDILSFKEYYPD